MEKKYIDRKINRQLNKYSCIVNNQIDKQKRGRKRKEKKKETVIDKNRQLDRYGYIVRQTNRGREKKGKDKKKG